MWVLSIGRTSLPDATWSCARTRGENPCCSVLFAAAFHLCWRRFEGGWRVSIPSSVQSSQSKRDWKPETWPSKLCRENRFSKWRPVGHAFTQHWPLLLLWRYSWIEKRKLFFFLLVVFVLKTTWERGQEGDTKLSLWGGTTTEVRNFASSQTTATTEVVDNTRKRLRITLGASADQKDPCDFFLLCVTLLRPFKRNSWHLQKKMVQKKRRRKKKLIHRLKWRGSLREYLRWSNSKVTTISPWANRSWQFPRHRKWLEVLHALAVFHRHWK